MAETSTILHGLHTKADIHTTQILNLPLILIALFIANLKIALHGVQGYAGSIPKPEMAKFCRKCNQPFPSKPNGKVSVLHIIGLCLTASLINLDLLPAAPFQIATLQMEIKMEVKEKEQEKKTAHVRVTVQEQKKIETLIIATIVGVGSGESLVSVKRNVIVQQVA